MQGALCRGCESGWGGHPSYIQTSSLMVSPSPQGLGMGSLGQGGSGAPPANAQDCSSSGLRFKRRTGKGRFWRQRAVDKIFPNKGNR